MTRLVRVSLLVLAGIMLVAMPVLGYLYRAPVSVSENASTDYDMLAVLWTQNNDWLATNGFMSSTANDTRVQTLGGSDKPWLVCDNKTLTSVPVPADSQTNLYFVTGESAASSMDIIVGYDGYVTMPDTDEPGDNFTIQLSGYFDTSAGCPIFPTVASNITSTKDAAGTSHTVSLPAGIESGDLIVVLFGGYYPSGTPTITFPGGWTIINKSANTYYCTGSAYRIAGGSENNTVTVTTASNCYSAHQAFRITGYTGVPEGATATSDLDPPSLSPSWGNDYSLYICFLGGGASPAPTVSSYPAGWVNGQDTISAAGYAEVGSAQLEIGAVSVNPGAFTTVNGLITDTQTIGVRSLSSIEGYIVDKLNALTVSITGGNVTTTIHDSTPVTVSGTIDSDDHVVKVLADGTDFELYIDDMVTPVDTTALGGASVPANADDWVLMSNAVPYLDYFMYSVNGILITWYQPNDIVSGTVLPDRQGGDDDGIITWGANPAGVGVTLGSMSSSGQPGVGTTGDTSTGDILPVVGGTDWRPDAGVSVALQANPLRPIVTAISDNTTLSEYQVWVWLGSIFVVFITVLVGANVRGHHLITGIAASVAIILMVVWDVFPMLSLLVVVLAILGGLISERSPSL